MAYNSSPFFRTDSIDIFHYNNINKIRILLLSEIRRMGTTFTMIIQSGVTYKQINYFKFKLGMIKKESWVGGFIIRFLLVHHLQSINMGTK